MCVFSREPLKNILDPVSGQGMSRHLPFVRVGLIRSEVP
ncbi:hypothetical protein EVA_20061 [gut metagenome]|uniref:Uncharacterized protein n=1 Tax=gut metagenome TaxID=749906 RepID=J9FBM3_9ZZZZ